MRNSLRWRSRSTSEVGVEVAHVVVQRELHVHVQRQPLRQQEGVVGDAARARDRVALAVVDAVDEAGEPQHVFRHALAPLAPSRRARERFAERLRGLGEDLRVPAGFLELRRELTGVLLALALDLVDETGELGEVAAHPVQLLVDQRLLAVELLGAEPALGGEHLLVGAHELRDRGLGGRRERGPILRRPHLELPEHLFDRHGRRGRLRRPGSATGAARRASTDRTAHRRRPAPPPPGRPPASPSNPLSTTRGRLRR